MNKKMKVLKEAVRLYRLDCLSRKHEPQEVTETMSEITGEVVILKNCNGIITTLPKPKIKTFWSKIIEIKYSPSKNKKNGFKGH